MYRIKILIFHPQEKHVKKDSFLYFGGIKKLSLKLDFYFFFKYITSSFIVITENPNATAGKNEMRMFTYFKEKRNVFIFSDGRYLIR